MGPLLLLVAVVLGGCVVGPPADERMTEGATTTTEGATTTSGAETTDAATTGGEASTSETGASSTGDESSGAEPSCGDGVVDPGEACDDGRLNADDAACTADCSLAVCGDGLLHSGVEVCDDGVNDGAYDGCLAGCSGFGPYCGDDLLQEDEEECEPAEHGALCSLLECTVLRCPDIPLLPASAEMCPPEVQVNATVSGETPLGPFVGAFAAQSFGSYNSGRYLVISGAYAEPSLCEPGPYLVVAFDDPSASEPGEYGVHVLAVIDGESAHAQGTATIKASTYVNADADADCSGSTIFAITVAGEGWSLAGGAEAGCCQSGHNLFVM